jgi:hypothetical protein
VLQKSIAANQPNREKSPSLRCLHRVVLRSNKKIQELATPNKGFRLLLKLLWTSVREFKSTKNDKGIPLTHRKVAEFFDLNLKQASDMLKKTEFELVFYPEWVNKVLDII